MAIFLVLFYLYLLTRFNIVALPMAVVLVDLGVLLLLLILHSFP